MVKLLICLISAMALAVMTLQLRQQRLELNYKVSQLHRQVESHQAKLWNQQLQIAVYTAPNAIVHTVSNHDLKLVPRAPVSQAEAAANAAAGVAGWIADPDAE